MKVVAGDLVRVRLGRQAAYVVHILGTKIPASSCERQAARADLRSFLKPGNVVKVLTDKKAPNRDKKGLLLRYMTKGRYDVGASQVDVGYASVDRSYTFGEKQRLIRLEKKAKAR